MNTLLLADGFDDAGIWVYLILAALGVLAGLFKKKQQQQPQKPAAKRPAQRVPEARPRVPAPPLASEVPPVPRPAAAPPTVGRARPIARAPGQLEPPPRPVPPPYRPPVRQPARPRVKQRLGPEPAEPASWEVADQQLSQGLNVEREVEPSEVGPIGEPARTAPSVAEGRAAITAAGPAPAEPGSLEPLLRCRSGLQAAIVLAEILAPPVGLRDNHPL